MMAYNGWLASTQFMGYNNETLYYRLVDQLVKSGLRDAGYTTVGVTCNGWIRDPATNKLTTHKETWPNGFKALVDYAHAHGIKIGAYTDTGRVNCCRDPLTGKNEPGSYGFEELDVQTFADVGVDQINVDNCANVQGATQSVLEYKIIHDALVKVGKPMVYAIWDVGMGKPWAWANRMGHYYRTASDLGNRWGQDDQGDAAGGMGVMYNYDIQQAIPGIAAQTKPGSFPFLDELMVGMPVGLPHGKLDVGLTPAESRTHFALWCMMASPLWITHNIFDPPPGVNEIVSHPEAIAVNQDPLGQMAVRVDGDRGYSGLNPRLPGTCGARALWPNGEQLARPLANGDWAVLLFNRLNATLTITLNFEDIGDTSVTRFHVRDIWARQDLGNFSGAFVAQGVAPHGDAFLRLTPLPPPPPPTCPKGFAAHTAGFWPNTTSFPCHGGDCDPATAACSIGGPKCRYGTSVEQCAALCANGPAPPGAGGHACTGFEVYRPQDTSACFTYYEPLSGGAGFEPDPSCFACVRQT